MNEFDKGRCIQVYSVVSLTNFVQILTLTIFTFTADNYRLNHCGNILYRDRFLIKEFCQARQNFNQILPSP